MTQREEESSFKELLAGLGLEGSGEEPPSTDTSAPIPSATEEPFCCKEVILAFEKRRGKPATIVRGIPPKQQGAVLKSLKKALASGGSSTADGLILQGDHRIALVQWFEAKAVRVRGERG